MTVDAEDQDAQDQDFVVSGDGHLLEPIDLFKTRLPEHLRDRAVWEEDFEIEPFVEGGATVFRRLHTAGYEGWTVSRYRQTGGRTPEGDPDIILEDMDLDGVDVEILFPPQRTMSHFLGDEDEDFVLAGREGVQQLLVRGILRTRPEAAHRHGADPFVGDRERDRRCAQGEGARCQGCAHLELAGRGRAALAR